MQGENMLATFNAYLAELTSQKHRWEAARKNTASRLYAIRYELANMDFIRLVNLVNTYAETIARLEKSMEVNTHKQHILQQTISHKQHDLMSIESRPVKQKIEYQREQKSLLMEQMGTAQLKRLDSSRSSDVYLVHIGTTNGPNIFYNTCNKYI